MVLKINAIILAALLLLGAVACDAAESAKGNALKEILIAAPAKDDLRSILLEQRKLDDEIEKLRAEYGKLQKRRQDLEKRISEQLGEKPKK